MYHVDDVAKGFSATAETTPTFGEVMRALADCHFARKVSGPPREESEGVLRDLLGQTGPDGGYAVPTRMLEGFIDHVRSYEPLGRCRWFQSPVQEFEIPVVAESTRVPGGRFGGTVCKWGEPRGQDLSAVPSGVNQPTVGQVKANCQRLTCYGPKVSEDLVRDGGPLLDYVLESTAFKEISQTIIDMLIGVAVPYRGLINAGATIHVSRAGSNAIALADIDKMFRQLYGACRRNAVWACSPDTLYALDTLATTEQWPTAVYMPQGVGGNEYPLLKSRPLLDCESCPVLGQPGDLCLFDASQIGIAIVTPASPRDGAALTVNVASGWQANLEMGFEKRRSSHRFWDTDQSIYMFKTRLDVVPLWGQSVTAGNSATNKLSPYVILTT
jgi:HK97 family phage major capsid protein